MSHPTIRARASLLAGAGFLALLAAGGARAQATSDQPAAAPTIKELVVTAEKRAGTVQTTALSITAYSGEQLQARGVSDAATLAYQTPGVSVRNSGPGQTEYEMRGVASAGGGFSTVGFYLDDVPLTAPEEGLLGKNVIDPTLYDLNRVEVLRGPQGTLYGASSMGGTIKLVTNQPDPSGFSFSAQAIGSGTAGGSGNYTGNVMINLPLMQDKIALRVVATEDYVGGWIDRIVLDPFPQETAGGTVRGDVLSAPVAADHKHSNWTRIDGARASLLVKPNDNLTLTPMVFFQNVSQGGPNYVDAPPGLPIEAHYQPFDLAEPYRDSFELFSLPIKYDIPGVEFSSSSAYYRRQTSLSQDSAEIGQDFMTAVIPFPDIFHLPNIPYADVGPMSAFEKDYTSQFSEEVRITSTGSGPLQWLVGGFFQDYDSTTFIGTTPVAPGGAALLTSLLGAPNFFYLRFFNNIKQYAGFGEASYRYGAFKLTAGLRYYSYQSKEDLTESGGLISGAGAPIAFVLPASASGVNPKVNLSFEPTSDLTFYVQAAKGFRPGGGNPPPPVTCPNNPLTYSPDGLWSYEAGEKARLFDRRLTLNGAVYFENWTGIQQLVSETCGATYTANAGTAHIYGGELEANLRLADGLSVSSATGYTHAQIVSALPGAGFSVGERVQDVPDWTNTTTLTYRRPVTPDYDLVLSGTNIYVGPMLDPTGFNLPSHDLINMRAGLSARHGVSAWLFVNNLTDKRVWLGDPEEIAFFVPAYYRETTNQPRTIGVELDYAFK